jgi:hypothetical protein
VVTVIDQVDGEVGTGHHLALHGAVREALAKPRPKKR